MQEVEIDFPSSQHQPLSCNLLELQVLPSADGGHKGESNIHGLDCRL